MDEIKESSSIETALKHHSSAQAAIKLLQDQLECLDQLRQSTKETFTLAEEKNLERSTNDLLSSTSHYLHNSSGSNLVADSSVLSSTLNKQQKLRDDPVIRNLLPSFEESQHIFEFANLPNKVSPIKANNQDLSQLTSLTPLTKDSLASTALHLTPFSAALSSANSLTDIRVSPCKALDIIPPSSGSMNLTEVLARLAYSGALAATNDGQESINSTSDELINLLEKISCTGEQLKAELQDARDRESKLVQEVQRLRSHKNGFSPNHVTTSHAEKSDLKSDLKTKCEKLEDALLSLQDENIKLNRLLKGQDIPSYIADNDENYEIKKKLNATEKENRALNDKLNGIKTRLSVYEEQLNEGNGSKLSIKDLQHSTIHSTSQKSDYEIRLEQKISKLEDELHMTLTGMNETKSLQLRINDLHKTLLDKDRKIKECEGQLIATRDHNRELVSKYEELHKNDVYKRKEVLQLCDKFEKLKFKYKKLEAELLAIRSEDQKENTRQWAMENSLHKLTKENETLQHRLNTEQRQLTMSKLLLEKDYSILKKRYDELLIKISRAEFSDPVNMSRIGSFCSHKDGDQCFEQRNATLINSEKNPSSHTQRDNSKLNDCARLERQSNQPTELEDRSDPLAKRYETSLHSLRRELNHRRHHTVPGYSEQHKPEPSKPNGLRVRSDTDVHYSNSTHAHVATSTPKRPGSNIGVHSDLHNGVTSPAFARSCLRNRIKTNNMHVPSDNKTSLSKSRNNPQKLSSNTGKSNIPENNKRLNLTTNDLHQRTKSAYEEEYLKNMNGIDRLLSMSDQSINTSNMTKRFSNSDTIQPTRSSCMDENLRSKSEVLSTNSIPHQRRRMHTEPSTSFAQQKDRYLVTRDGLPYGESPYSKEYLNNMNGVRLVVNLSNGSSGSDLKAPRRNRSLSPIKSILKSSVVSSTDSSTKHKPDSSYGLQSITDISTIAPSVNAGSGNKRHLNEQYNQPSTASTAKLSTISKDESTTSKQSEKSLHLSDLPCDQATVYDKFRNFDSHLNDYKQPPPIPHAEEEARKLVDAENELMRKRDKRSLLQRHSDTNKQKEDVVLELSNKKPLISHSAIRKDEESDSIEQSSVSTTRDHAGRIEFLREIQIKTGVRMPALMHDITVRDDVLVSEGDMNNEVKLGLSNNQEAYADKLVKKYMKKGKAVYNDM